MTPQVLLLRPPRFYSYDPPRFYGFRVQFSEGGEVGLGWGKAGKAYSCMVRHNEEILMAGLAIDYSADVAEVRN